MDDDGPQSGGRRRPPLNLTREAYGYLVIAAGVALALVALWNLPENVTNARLLRILVAFVIAAATGYVYQYVTNTWYDQFE